MTVGRKSVVLMLVVALLFSALPMSACLLGGSGAGHPVCCQEMAHHCMTHGMAMNGPCCQVHRQHTLVIPKASFSPKHPQTIVLLPHRSHSEFVRNSVSLRRFTQAHVPPDTSPGGNSILRI